MPFPDLSQLPPWAVVAFGISLAIILGLAYIGERRGRNAGPSASQSTAQVAAVIVDPTALLAATAAVEGFSTTLREAMATHRAHTAAVDRQSDKIEQLEGSIEKLRDQMVFVAAKMG